MYTIFVIDILDLVQRLRLEQPLNYDLSFFFLLEDGGRDRLWKSVGLRATERKYIQNFIQKFTMHYLHNSLKSNRIHYIKLQENRLENTFAPYHSCYGVQSVRMLCEVDTYFWVAFMPEKWHPPEKPSDICVEEAESTSSMIVEDRRVDMFIVIICEVLGVVCQSVTLRCFLSCAQQQCIDKGKINNKTTKLFCFHADRIWLCSESEQIFYLFICSIFQIYF